MAVLHALVEKAKTGGVPACRELLGRAIGKPKSTVESQADEQVSDELNDQSDIRDFRWRSVV